MLTPNKIYKIYHIDNSFKKSLDILFNNIIIDEYSIKEIKYPLSTLSPDNIKIGSSIISFKKPDYLYILIYLVSDGVYLSSGFGQKYCECKLNSNQKIYVNWDSSIPGDFIKKKKILTFDNKIIRKIKLKNLNNEI